MAQEHYRADRLSETVTKCFTVVLECPGVLHGVSVRVNSVLTFLVEIAKRDKLAYRTIGLYKSAISQTHDPIGSVPLGEHPIVSQSMKGVLRIHHSGYNLEAASHLGSPPEAVYNLEAASHLGSP
jgi:hypothetical protein